MRNSPLFSHYKIQKGFQIFRTLFISLGILASITSFSYAQSTNIEIWVECVKPLSDGTYIAHFGYNNKTGEQYKVPESKSVLVYNGGDQKTFAVNIFEPGIHYFAEERGFQGSDRVKWRLTMPNGNVQEVIANSGTSPCVPKLALTINGPTDVLIGETVTLYYEVSHDSSSDQSPISGVSIFDDLNGAINIILPQGNGDEFLDTGETWSYTSTFQIPIIEVGGDYSLDNGVTASGFVSNNVPVQEGKRVVLRGFPDPYPCGLAAGGVQHDHLLPPFRSRWR